MSSRKQIVLWGMAAFLATAGLVAALIRERRLETRQHAMYVVGIPEKGEALFFGAKRCSVCHAVNGKGGKVGPDLASIHPGKPAMGWLATVLWNHAPEMWRRMRDTGPPRLSQEDMAHLLAFLHRAGTGDRPGDPVAGARVFAEKGCQSCHASPPPARDPVAWVRDIWNHAHTMAEPIKKRAGEWPEFLGDEMNDLMAYVNGTASAQPLRGNAEHGWQVFQAKCMQCHSVDGKGGKVGPELGPERDLPNSTPRFAAVLWNHAPSMLKHAREASLSMPKLDGDEIKDVQTFLISLQYFEPAGSPYVGERVFAERRCARCHGKQGEGTSEAPAIRAGAEAFTTVSLATALWTHGPQMWHRAERLGIAWPALESTDIGDLISFLNTPAR